MERAEFKDPILSDQLLEEGMVILPLLSKEEIEVLKSLFQDYHKETPEGFYATTHAEDKSWRRELSNKIMAVVGEKIEAHFSNIQLLGGAFISKAPGEKGVLPLHQDWNIVNEKQARSYNLWIPLVDVNEKNGAMRILEQSHRKEETYRGPNLYPSLMGISAEVDKHMISLNMNAGSLLVYDHALWHSSPVNQTNELRLAVVIGALPKEAEMMFYFENDSRIEEYKSNPDFFFDHDPKDGPVGLELNNSFEFNTPKHDLAGFESVYLGKTKRRKGFFNFLRRN